MDIEEVVKASKKSKSKKKLQRLEQETKKLEPKPKKRKKGEKEQANVETFLQEQNIEDTVIESQAIQSKMEEILTRVEGRDFFNVKRMREFLSGADEKQRQIVVDKLADIGSRCVLCLDDVIRNSQGLESRHRQQNCAWSVASMLRVKEIKQDLTNKPPDLSTSLLRTDVVAMCMKAIQQSERTIQSFQRKRQVERDNAEGSIEQQFAQKAFQNIKTTSLLGTKESTIQMQLQCLQQGIDIFSDLEKKLLIDSANN
eukprot:TRINITY_DN4011_c1_g3_i1.p1 TRINITY_DN4011_c1_g3~~TRINITY_DN4011_c1_g3_i1.p1  ORF type:complete len:264 (-),score=25.56 TRINITY_DN4011_c1_g3_i1:86-853(-)